MMDGSATHYYLCTAKVSLCGRASGYATTDARDVSCAGCWRLIEQGWRRAERDRVERAIAFGGSGRDPGRWPKRNTP